VAANPEVTVLVVDEHPIWREGVARDLSACGCTVLATVADTAYAARVAAAVEPRVVLIDLDPAAVDAVEPVRTITQTLSGTRVLVLSERAGHRDVLDAVKAGASGYLVKTAAPDELTDAVRRTAEGAAVFTPGLADLVLGEYQRLARQAGALGGPAPSPAEVPAPVPTPAPVPAVPADPAPVAAGPAGAEPAVDPVPRLTERETEVLGLVAAGLTSRQVATRLGLSPRTVENHVQSTLRKLQLHNRIELVRYAISQGLAE
jgi:DNA-binding NarL/FixJ family response regulator